MASKFKKSSVYGLFSSYAIIPTRQVETQSKLFCIDRLIPFGFIWYQLSQSYGVSDFLLSKSYQGMLSTAERFHLSYPRGGNGSCPWESLSRISPFGRWITSSDSWLREMLRAILIASVCVWVLAVAREFPSPFTCHPPLGCGVTCWFFPFILSSFQKMKRMKPPTSFLWLLFSSFYGNAKCFQAILTGVNALAIFKRNKRSIDVLYGIVMSFSYKHSPSFKRDFSETNFGFAWKR